MHSRKQHTADLLIVLLLFFIFAGSALTLCALGAGAYRQTVADLQEGYNQRSGILYIAQKVQQGDIGGGVRLDTFQDNDALVLVEQVTGQGFETWIFILDGYLCEQVIAAGGEVIVEQAQKIMPMEELRLSLSDNNLLGVSITTDTGTVNELSLALRSNGGAFNTGNTPPVASLNESSNTAQDGPTIMTPAQNEGSVS